MGSGVSLRFFDPFNAICDNHYYVGDKEKQITFRSGVEAFIDLSSRRCIYDTNLVGHLVEFTFDSTKYYHSTVTSASTYTDQDNSIKFDAYVTSIKCRHYDKTTKALSLKSYTTQEVVISGL